MRTYRLFQVDAFTREKYAGNPAGVVPDAEGLGERGTVTLLNRAPGTAPRA